MLTDNSQISERKLNTLTAIIKLLRDSKSFDKTLQQICDILPQAYSIPGEVSVKITVDEQDFFSKHYRDSPWLERKLIACEGMSECYIEIHFSEESEVLDNKEIRSEDDDFLSDIVMLLSGIISRYFLEKLSYDNSERLKELEGITRTTNILKRGESLEESLQQICAVLPEAWQFPEFTAARIIYNDKTFESRKFKPTPWVMTQSFEIPDQGQGLIEIYYLKEFPQDFEGPFLEEERILLDNLAAIISGMVSKKAIQVLLKQNTERLKELRGINQTTRILKQSESLEDSLDILCAVLPEAWQYPEATAIRIVFEDKIFTSPNFTESKWVQKQAFEAPGKKKGTIEIFYLKEFPDADEGPFLIEERNLLINISNIIAGSATREVFDKLLNENKERLKELNAINKTSEIITAGKPVEETLQQICCILPKSWQYPRYTAVRIRFEEKEYCSREFKDTPWFQQENFITLDNKKGSIEIFYLKSFLKAYEGPFLKEERNLLINICKLISGYLDNLKGREIVQKNILQLRAKHKPVEYRASLAKNKNPLQLFFNKQIADKYIYLDMMKFKVKEILFVATLYDAFTLQTEGSFFEQFMGEIYQYSLFSLPRITGVTSSEEAMELMDTTHFDLVILMAGIDRDTPVQLSRQMKQKQPGLLIYLLSNQKSNIQYYEDLIPRINSIDKLFIWNGHSQIFFAMVKSLEDKVNVDTDTKIGLVRIILLIEDSAQYYSKYLQILYSIVFGHVQKLLPEVETNELDKIAKMRSRPKILHAQNYEDAVYIFNKYKDFLVCIISDVAFEKEGKLDHRAGMKFINYVKSHIHTLPILLQSSDDKNIKIAQKLDVIYMNKNSETLLNDFKRFLTNNMGIGGFVFYDNEGKRIAVAHSLREFETHLQHIPDESFTLHAQKNQFSLWLMTRGEIELARSLNPIRMDDFSSVHEARTFFIEQLRKCREEKKKGKILSFEETPIINESNIITFSGGSFGGKGRGLAFINTLINNLDLSSLSGKINIRIPKTVIIGIDEFDQFLEHNKLYDEVIKPGSGYMEIRRQFVKAKLSHSLMIKLRDLINQINKPIVVRSSSLLEDSVSQPFAGIFDTYIIPYSGDQKQIILELLSNAIKLVFASIYSDDARAYFNAIHHKIEEEKMGIVLQELVGNRYGDYYYPHISGVAQSYNYYPLANMDPEEGFAVIAAGLGAYVVGGNNSYRFSPKHPKIEMYTTKDLINSSQVKFYALDYSKMDTNYVEDGEMASLSLLDISEAEQHGTLKHCAAVYNALNDRIEPGLSNPGTRILNFAEILQNNYIPLSKTIEVMLKTIKEALGSPVEIEFAVDLTPTINNLPSFYLLQVKPLVSNLQDSNLDVSLLDKSKMILYSQASLGNGEIDNLRDVIYIDPVKFDRQKTLEMVNEMEYMNKLMREQNKHYILVGPGRWGTSDRFLGISVSWHQISNAKVIVETSLSNFPLDSSQGSHFFHNITSMNIGYLSIQDSSVEDFIRWEILNNQEVIDETKYVKHIRFRKPVSVVMNGRKRSAAILDNSLPDE